MIERKRLARGISTRVAEYETTGESDHVVGLDALAEAAALWRLIAGSPHGSEETVALGTLFWSRFTARPESDEGQMDLATALELAVLLSAGNPMATPDYFREGLQRFHPHIEAYMNANSGGRRSGSRARRR